MKMEEIELLSPFILIIMQSKAYTKEEKQR